MGYVVEAVDLHRIYESASGYTHALRGVTLSVAQGEFLAIMGPSGSGKSTLMNLLGCLDTPTRGRYLLEGIDVADYREDELAEIAVETAECAKLFGIDPQVAFLSYSTKGSGKGEDVDKMRRAAQAAKQARPDLMIEGELQFDAAVSPEVAQTKCKDLPVAGHANTFIFPDINAGNIGYKIAQRLGGFEAYGPILLGLNAPINDLSRGCNAEEVYYMAIMR